MRLIQAILGGMLGLMPITVLAAPTVSNVSAQQSVGVYQKQEIAFDVSTTASNLYWPYDTSPNPGVTARVGVSVDGLFSSDNWATTVTQPGFYYQDYDRNGNWLYPKGNAGWRIRFAPTSVGQWKYKVRVTDNSGITTTPEYSFTCTTSSSHGFVKVSNNDCRYFDTSDGNYLNLVGLSDATNKPASMDSLYSTLGGNGINLLRVWWQGSQGPVVWGISGQGGIPGWGGFDISSTYARPGEMFSCKITGNNTASTAVDVKPGKTYRYSAWIKTVGVSGPVDSTKRYGAWLQAFDLDGGMADAPLTTAINGDRDWTQVSATITTKSDETQIGWLKVVVDNVSGGSTYVTDLSLQEDLGGGQYGPNLLRWPDLNMYKYVSQPEAFKADYQVESARQNGIYLKVCLQEKCDQIFASINANGAPVGSSDDNVYASPTHASRTYQQYLWRYVIARYGYATSIHSFEFCNEGDPFNGNHTDALKAMAAYFRQNDPNQHLVTTSTWHSYPTKEMLVPAQPGYTDWHQYVGLQAASGELQYICGWQRDGFLLDTTNKHSGNASLHLKGTGGVVSAYSFPFSITPGHTYTLKWWCKGQNLVESGTQAADVGWVYPTLEFGTKDGWWNNQISDNFPGKRGDFMGTFGWTQGSVTYTAESNARYLILSPSTHWAVGDVWFDDITLHDDTTGDYIEVPNGNFESARLDYDSALLNWSIGSQVGDRTTRIVKSPCIRGELGISGDKVYSDPYKGFAYTGENQQLVDDQNGIWYKKLVWGQMNSFGVVSMYWWRDNIMAKGLYKYAKAYQTFMSGVPLSNGNYQDAKAVVSNPNLRVWGQKNPVNNRALLWIDNTPYNWKSVVDGVQVPTASGTVTLSGLADGSYAVEWWDTATGTVARTETVNCSSGNIVLNVTGLQSDIACKVYSQGGVDSTPPVVSITSPAQGSSTTSGSISISGTAGDASGLTSVTWSNSQGGSGACSGTTSWSAGGIALSPGSNTITVTATDAAGNRGTSSVTVTYNPPDTTNPNVAITAPTSSGAYTTTAATLSIGGTASDNVGVSSVTWSNSRGGGGACSGTTSWSASGIALQSGSNVITVTASDAAGNRSTAAITVTYNPPDTTNPSISITSPTSSGTYTTTSSTLSIGGTASDNIGVASVTWSSDKGGSGTCSGTASWSASGITLQSGSNVITVTATDAAGNKGTSTLTVTYNAPDTTNPSISITSPTSSGAYTATSATLSIGGTASDNVGVTSVSWSNSTGGAGTCTGTTSWSGTGITLQPGANVITVTASDAAGNKGTSSITVTYNPPDTTNPGVSITSPTTSGTYTTTSSTLSIGGTASDNVGVTTVTWSSDKGGSGTCSGTTSWSCSGITLQSGSNVITVTATDAAGNKGTTTLTVTYTAPDTTKPTITITSPSSSGSYSTTSSTLSIGGTASDNTAVTTVTWSSDKGGSGTCTGTSSWTASGITLQSGSNVITVTASDAAGNTATATFTVTYTPASPTNPTVAITSPTTATTYSTNSNTLRLSGTSSGAGVNQVTWTCSRGGTGTAVSNGSWVVPGITLLSGTNNITVTARDSSGQTANATLAVTYTAPSNSAPGIVITSPTAKDTYSVSTAAVQVGGYAWATNGLSKVTWANSVGGSGNCTGGGTWQTGNVPLKSGENRITVTAYDRQGLTRTDSIAVTCTARTMASALLTQAAAGALDISVTSPTTTGSFVTASAVAHTIAGTASGPDGITSVSWSDEYGRSGVCTGTTDWSVSDIPLGDDTNVITFTATDGSGNTADTTLTVIKVVLSTPDAWQGQTMVSVPIFPDTQDPKAVIGFSGTGWFSFGAQTGAYTNYGSDPNRLSWFTDRALTPLRGFWARFDTQPLPSLYGDLPPLDQPAVVHLMPGFNLIGQPFLSPVKWSLSTLMVSVGGSDPKPLGSCQGIVKPYAYGWKTDSKQPTTGSYCIVADPTQRSAAYSELAPWQAYWVIASQECDLIIPAP